jgi:hypothetical protein
MYPRKFECALRKLWEAIVCFYPRIGYFHPKMVATLESHLFTKTPHFLVFLEMESHPEYYSYR